MVKKTKKRSRDKYAERHAKAWCKRRGVCEAAGLEGVECNSRKPGWPLLEWCHIIGRSAKRLKFYPENAVCLCGQHHAFYTSHPASFNRFIETSYPGRMDKLYDLERNGPKWGLINNDADHWIQTYKDMGVRIGKTVSEDFVQDPEPGE